MTCNFSNCSLRRASGWRRGAVQRWMPDDALKPAPCRPSDVVRPPSGGCPSGDEWRNVPRAHLLMGNARRSQQFGSVTSLFDNAARLPSNVTQATGTVKPDTRTALR
jgi:hypothetical protein